MVEFKCDQCDKTFKMNNSLKRHEKAYHKGLRYECNTCNKKFTRKHDMQMHMKFVHEGALKNYQCEDCDKRYRYAKGLREHKAAKHPGIQYQCVICNKNYTQSQTRALKTQSLKFKCEECDKRNENPNGTENSNLINYVIDPEIIIETPIENESSDCEFESEDELVLDKIVNLKNDEDEGESSTNKARYEIEKTALFCKPCDQLFQNESELLLHVKVSHTITILKCNKCPKIFTEMKDLLLHNCK